MEGVRRGHGGVQRGWGGAWMTAEGAWRVCREMHGGVLGGVHGGVVAPSNHKFSGR